MAKTEHQERTKANPDPAHPERPPGFEASPEWGMDDYVTLPKACRLPELRINGRPRHPAQMYRYVYRGVRGIKLKTSMVGFVRVTTRRFVREFIEQTTAAADVEREANMDGSTPAREGDDLQFPCVSPKAKSESTWLQRKGRPHAR